ncbi:MAG: 3-dehydroquinate synthase [Candidatus Peribacter sp.]|jgi:3-dehydroquinate synthase
MKTITLQPQATKSATYPIIIEEGSLGDFSQLVDTHDFDSVAILYDESVERIAEDLQRQLKMAYAIRISNGEQSKSLREVERIASMLLEHGIMRQSFLINVGGGMVTDLGGFIASVYMRGISFVNVPTTLLGMVDASVGGKTGVNLKAVKNVIGSFHHPKAVIIDAETLQSLPDEQFREGLVEVIKIAAMADAEFFRKLEQSISNILSGDRAALNSCIADAVRLKAKIVSTDERDANDRLLLNFGHTVGHALEALSNYQLSHGKAISIGMAQEMMLAETKDASRVIALLEKIGMPTEMPDNISMNDLLTIMEKDKKILDHKIRFAAPREIGVGVVMTLPQQHR